jgi:hypothetical protein
MQVAQAWWTVAGFMTERFLTTKILSGILQHHAASAGRRIQQRCTPCLSVL